MIQANVSKNNEKQHITAGGTLPEIAGDIAVLLSGIHTQLLATSPAAAELFKQAVQKIVADDDGPCWRTQENQTGIAITLPGDPNDP